MILKTNLPFFAINTKKKNPRACIFFFAQQNHVLIKTETLNKNW